MSSSKLESFLRVFQADTQLREFQDPVREDLDRVEDLIRHFFQTPLEMLDGISDHLLGFTGKKFRPTLLLLIARSGTGQREEAVFSASVIELIHTATLIHDDTIDQSNLRRGLPTINALFNDYVATILGDYIYTKAFVELLDRGLPEVVPVVARTTYQMSIGEMLQIQQKNDLDLTEEDYFRLVDAKTASLMAASTEIGALVGGLDRETVLRHRRFGEDLGRAYQVTDDLFDFVGNQEEIGKGVQSDLVEGKVTLPFIQGMARAGTRDRNRLQEMAARRRTLSPDEWRSLLEILETSGAIEYCREKALRLAESALRHLDGQPSSPYRIALEKAVAYAVQRSH